MSLAASDVRAVIPDATPGQAEAILGAMRAVAEEGAPASEADRQALASAGCYMFGHAGPFDFDALPAVTPDALASALRGSGLAEDAVKFLTVMAFIDGSLDRAKIDSVLRYAAALGIHERYIDEIAEAARDRIQEALADMTRANMESITGRPWEGDVNRWLMPYAGANADPELEKRFEALGQLDADTFGRTYYDHFKDNGYAFPGDPKALNAAFAVPHDSAHVLSGYNTTARGELLVSTFTAAMHRKFPMAGHVLPVIFSWHLRIQLNKVAGAIGGALDPNEFWHAWAGGAETRVDTFAPDWDFWAYVGEPLAALRTQWAIPPDGLDRRGPR